MYEREQYIRKIEKFIDKPVIKVISGAKRTGKSTLLSFVYNKLIEHGIQKEDIIQVNFEYYQYDGLRYQQSLYRYICDLAKKNKRKMYILIDEVQEVEQWEQVAIKFMQEVECDLYVTGSVGTKMIPELEGKCVVIPMYTLSFAEYLDFLQVDAMGAGYKEILHDSMFENYMKFGGYPGVHTMVADEHMIKQYIRGIYSYVMLKDIVQRNDIRDTVLLEKIAFFLAWHVGDIMSPKKVADILKSQGNKAGVETVYHYIEALMKGMAFYKVLRFDIKKNREMSTLEKYYLCDNGFWYGLLGRPSSNTNGMLENVVYLELLRRDYEVYTGKYGSSEIDFVAMRNDEVMYIQTVPYLENEMIVSQEFGVLKSMQEPGRKIVISMDEQFSEASGDVEWMNICDFLLEQRRREMGLEA